MIKLSSKYDCCGCEACAQRCPHNAIEMQRDKEGFLYPQISRKKCIDCGLCEQVCPIINQRESTTPIATYAAKNKEDKIRLSSSSGGIFTLLANKIIENNGVVFGAKFNEKWEVVHGYAKTADELANFRGSKYVQSHIGDNFKIAEQFLKSGRKVLFSGTPCQIAGLKLFLRRNYPNLTCIDIICYGIPSPMVWGKYINQHGSSNISAVSFRDKSNGWKNYELAIDGTWGNIVRENTGQNIYMKLFLQNLILRPSCAQCPAKGEKRNSDITIADYWGIQHVHPEFDDDKGCNLVIINSEKGQSLFNSIICEKIQTDLTTALSFNPSYKKSITEHKYRKYFFKKFPKKGFEVYDKILKKQQPSILRRIIWRIKRIFLK